MGSAFSSNSAFLMEGISINSNESCTARLYQNQSDNRFVSKSVSCGGDFNVGTQIAQQQVNCRNDQQVAATARAAASQAATSKISGLAAIGQSTANNIVDMQQNIAMSLQGRCDASLQQTIHGESYKSGPVVAKGSCNVYTQAADQRFTCTNSIIASASDDESATQTATASVSGLDFSALLMILIIGLLLVVFLIFAPVGMLVKSVFSGTKKVVSTAANAVKDTAKTGLDIVGQTAKTGVNIALMPVKAVV